MLLQHAQVGDGLLAPNPSSKSYRHREQEERRNFCNFPLLMGARLPGAHALRSPIEIPSSPTHFETPFLNVIQQHPCRNFPSQLHPIANTGYRAAPPTDQAQKHHRYQTHTQSLTITQNLYFVINANQRKQQHATMRLGKDRRSIICKFSTEVCYRRCNNTHRERETQKKKGADRPDGEAMRTRKRGCRNAAEEVTQHAAETSDSARACECRRRGRGNPAAVVR